MPGLCERCNKVMDCFLLYGIEIIFRIALTLLSIGRHELLLLDIEGVIKVKSLGIALVNLI